MQSVSCKPIVSVVVIFLNEERFLAEAIHSVLGQTTPHWELLLVDDGSTDQSPTIAQQFAARDPDRIRYLTHPGGRNRGKSISRNLGIQEARADYLTFLDGDDVLRPDKLERQSALLDRNEAAMVYGTTLYWFDWPGAPQPPASPNYLGYMGVPTGKTYPPPQLLTMYLEVNKSIPCICGLMVRRSVALEIGGFSEKIQDMFEDQIFLARVCASYPVYVEDGCGEWYRQHANSTSYRAIASGYYHPLNPNPAQRAYLEWLENHLQEKRITDPALHRALRRSLRPYRHPRLHRAATTAINVRNTAIRRLKRILRPLRPRKNLSTPKMT